VESIKLEIVVQASLGENQDPISKITKTKRAEGVAQEVEPLANKGEAPVLTSPLPHTLAKKKVSREKKILTLKR
jgi:hypothetical protein